MSNNVLILQGNCIETLKGLPAGSVQTSVSSPPYYGLRDYGTAKWEGGDPECKHQEKRGGTGASSYINVTNPGTQNYQYKDVCKQCGARRIDEQIGLEETPEAFIQKLVEVYREVWRVLKDDGTLWINIGDSYAANRTYQVPDNKHTDVGNSQGMKVPNGCKPKDLIGIPWMLAFALRADGWYLRRDIIWYKDNPMPESADDRPTTSHEYIFLLSKQPRYYFDMEAIKEPAKVDPAQHITGSRRNGDNPDRTDNDMGARMRAKYRPSNGQAVGGFRAWRGERAVPGEDRQTLETEQYVPATRNKRSVWRVPTKSYKEAHFATYPEELIEPCILAGTSARGECPTCGKAWERVIKKETTFESGSGKAGNPPNGKNGSDYEQAESGDYDIRMGPITETTTLGWRPGCRCYGLTIIPDPPKKPMQKQKESKKAFAERMIQYGKASLEWARTWQEMKPWYNACETVPQTVLDPFNGSGTTGAVSIKHRRKYVGCELNPKYIPLTHRRLAKVQPLLIGT